MTEKSNVAKLQTAKPAAEAENELVELARARARQWLIAATSRSQGDIASGTKFSRATINLWLKGKYGRGDNAAVAREVLRFLERDAKAGEIEVTLEPVPTSAFQAVQTALDIAKYTKRIAVICGPPGTGKTFAAQQYVEQDPKYNLLLWTRYGMGSPKGFIAELWRVLKNEDCEVYRYPARMSGWVIRELKQNSRFIVVNDAHRLRFPIFEFACDLVEQAGVGLAFVGHDLMEKELNKLERRDSETFDRVADFSNFAQIEHDCTPGEIGQVAKQILPDITKEAVAFLSDLALFKSMRAVVNTCLVAKSLRQRTTKQIAADGKLIKQALKQRRPEL